METEGRLASKSRIPAMRKLVTKSFDFFKFNSHFLYREPKLENPSLYSLLHQVTSSKNFESCI